MDELVSGLRTRAAALNVVTSHRADLASVIYVSLKKENFIIIFHSVLYQHLSCVRRFGSLSRLSAVEDLM